MSTTTGTGSMDKASLRAAMRRRRRAVPSGEAREAAMRLAKGLVRHPLVTPLAPGAVLVPARHGDEIDSEPLARALEDAGWQVHRPRSAADDTRIEVVPYASHAPLVAGAHGVPEPPPEAPTVAPETLRLVLVPGLAFALDGARLGTGLGYFDRFLAPLKAQRDPPVMIGIGYRFQLAASVPVAAHDVNLHGLQLEEQAVKCAPAGPSPRGS